MSSGERCIPRGPGRLRPRRSERGFVLLVVLFVLLALFVFTAPFLTTARNADRASRHLADRAQARLALDAAGRRARVRLEASHASVDATPYFDDLDELSAVVDARRDAERGGLNPHDPRGVMWSAEVHDLAGRIDLDSAPPQVLANLLGAISRVTEPATAGADVLDVVSADAFPPAGVLVLDGELIRFDGRDAEGRLALRQRGVETVQDDEGQWITNGPRPPSGHGVGSGAIDQRAFAPVIWRTATNDGEPRDLDTLEQLVEADAFALAGSVSEFAFDVLRRHATTDDGLRAGPRWQRSTRLVSSVRGGVTFGISVEDSRWFNDGATVKVTDGVTTELRYVTRRTQAGLIFLDRSLEYDYAPWQAEVAVLARRPLNVNTATAEALQAVFENVGLANANARIDAGEARELAALTIASRPFIGMQDWLQRVVLPAAGIERLPDDAPVVPPALAGDGQVLNDERDAVALYINGLNANDARLGFSTMPLCFTSRDTYSLELRAAVNAESGLLRASAVRERVELVTPQADELFHLFIRQEDFDEALRLGRRAPWWATGPEATTRYDAGVEPPSRAVAHLGTLQGAPYIPGISDPVFDDEGAQRRGEHVFASRGDDAWCQLAPGRTFEMGELRGRMEHFDHELRDLEGRYLPDETLAYDPTEPPVLWAPPNGLMRPISFEAWVQPRQAGDGTLFSVGGTSGDVDRVLLGMEGDDLVLRVLDGFGDHRLTAEREAGEARFRLGATDVDPGFPASTWHHVKVDVEGNRPDQIGLQVNGLAAGVRRPGLTRLTAALSQGGTVISVESTEGFPSRGVVRIADELLEYELSSGSTMTVSHSESGATAGSGGRLARMRWNEVERIPEEIGTVTVSHPRGTPVALYGYSAELATGAPSGGSQLPSALGPWRVARVLGTPSLNELESIQVTVQATSLQLGLGWLPETTGQLVLALGDDPGGDPDGSRVMSGFSPTGGYAALVATRLGSVNGSDPATPNNFLVGGVEIVRYSGWQGNQISIVERDATGSLPRYLEELQNGDDPRVFEGARGWVFDWDPTWAVQQQGGVTLIEDLMSWQTYLLPISLPAPGANQITFLQNTDGNSQFAQLTELAEPEATEWVRYDDVDSNHGFLVRSDRFALSNAYNAIQRGAAFDLDAPIPGGGPGGGGGGGGGGGAPGPLAPSGGSGPQNPGGPGAGAAGPPGGILRVPARAVAVRPTAPRAGSDWDPFRGEDPNLDLPLSRAVGAALHHRGVLGTSNGTHVAGTRVLPVFQIFEAGAGAAGTGNPGARLDGGLPGAGDPVFLSSESPADLGTPLRVHRAHLASPERPRFGWEQVTAGEFVATETAPYDTNEVNGDRLNEVDFGGYRVYGRVYVAFDDFAPFPVAPTSNASTDARTRARIVKFPSGELPRFVGGAAVGAGALGAADFGVPSASIDEIAFGHTTTFVGLPGANPAEHTAGASLVLNDVLEESEQGAIVEAYGVRAAAGRRGTGSGAPALARLPQDAGLLRIGEEIVAYSGYDAGNGGLAFAVNGRGRLGTRPQPHGVSEPVMFMPNWTVTTLAAAVSATDATLPIVDRADFPPMGLVLIDDELIHYTRIEGGGLDMPRRSSEPGAMDGRGEGVFRGRFGTAAAGHAAGTAVILFPFRYWDRYAARFDGPELAYFGFDQAQPGAWWSGVTFDAEPGQWGGADLVVLQRTDSRVPWDADPEETEGLTLIQDGTQGGDLVPINAQSDRIEWRVVTRFRTGAFDPLRGLDHGWKESPRLRHLGVSYYGPGQVLRSVDR